MQVEVSEAVIKQLNERFRREAKENRERTLGHVVYTLVQIHGDVSYETIRSELRKRLANSPSALGQITPELDTQLHDTQEALWLLEELHEPFDD